MNVFQTDNNVDTRALLISGFLWSGSSAVVDLLKSSSEIGILPGEFDEFRRPGMVADHLAGMISEYYPSTLPSSFSASSYVGQIMPFDRKLKYRTVQQRARKSRLIKLAEKLREFDNSDDQKRRYADEWLVSLKKLFAPGKKYLLIDQPILWGQHSETWPVFFDPFKMIVVARNPLDQLAEVMRQNNLLSNYSAPDADTWGGGRQGAFNYTLHTLLVRILHYQRIRESMDSENLLFVKFEELVNNPDTVIPCIADFLGVNEDSLKRSETFRPEISRKNININEMILTSAEKNQLAEVQKIFESSYELHFELKTEFSKEDGHQVIKVSID